MMDRHRVLAGVVVAAICGLILTGCVPGGYSVETLSMEPEAALTYPGSTEVTTDKMPGRVQFGLDGGDVAATGISATTTHTQLEVLDYYTHALEADGWDQILDNPGMLLPSGARGHSVLWWKTGPKLSYSVLVWAEGETTKYSTEIEARR